MTRTNDPLWRAGWRLANAVCSLSRGRLTAEAGEACSGFYEGIRLHSADDRDIAFLNLSECGGSFHVFRVGHATVRLDWTGPTAGAEWPPGTVAEIAVHLDLNNPA